ncbi:MAG: aromatic ring-hydroxylating dioxygenase subunit alpha [Candidatus Eremiobacteraeota bacterium]|nr:aromatic ring-hydroxylating dioxygenase subunit alpha [Candidatus Eremiobacteraeota bacterium]
MVAEQGLESSLPRAAYWDEAFFERERRAIFWNQWFFAGRADRFAEPGAYAVFEVAGESVIVIAGRDGTLHGHLNFCRHRGSRLLCGEGVHRGAIRCPYHGWAYDTDGTLLATPFVEDEAVPAEARRLHEVAVDMWGGFLFVRVSRGQQSLLEQLGEIPNRLSRYPLAELRTVRSIVYEVDANWKVLLENYNECYHCAGVHPELCQVVPAFKRRGGSGLDWERGIPHREGAWTFTSTGTSNRKPFAGLDEDERVRHKGELIYPNFMLSLSADHVAAFSLWPQSAARTTVACDFLFHPDAIAASDFDPSDAIEFWDLVNRQDWAICAMVQDGMRSHKFEYGYYAPMEDSSLDIRRYVKQRLGDT